MSPPRATFIAHSLEPHFQLYWGRKHHCNTVLPSDTQTPSTSFNFSGVAFELPPFACQLMEGTSPSHLQFQAAPVISSRPMPPHTQGPTIGLGEALFWYACFTQPRGNDSYSPFPTLYLSPTSLAPSIEGKR